MPYSASTPKGHPTIKLWEEKKLNSEQSRECSCRFGKIDYLTTLILARKLISTMILSV